MAQVASFTDYETGAVAEIELAVLGSRTFAGNLIDFSTAAAGRLSLAERAGTTTPFSYDGRSDLSQAGEESAALGAT